MTRAASPDAREIYRHEPARYDALVRAEDHRGNLRTALQRVVRLRGAIVVEVGAGTGRVTRLLLEAGVAQVLATDRERAMIGFAREVLPRVGGRLSLGVADGVRLPFRGAVADLGIAGWVFGHLRHWLPDGWRTAIGAALDELARVVREGETLAIIETLGTGCEIPSPPDPGLAEYYEWLERERGFARAEVRTDFRFESVEEAAASTGFFFGAAFAERVRRERWSVIPECTGLWTRRT